MAFLDPFRRAFGKPTAEEIETAHEARLKIISSTQPEDLFATALANRVQDMSPDAASHIFHGLKNHSWSSDPNIRWHQTAQVAQDLAKETIAKPVANMDKALSEATTRRALVETAIIMQSPDHRDNAERVLADSIKAVRDDVLAFMSYGKAAEHNAITQANAILSLPRSDSEFRLREDVSSFLPAPTQEQDLSNWTLKATRLRLAMAHSGVLPADRTVEAAVEAGQFGTMEQGPLAPYDRQFTIRSDHETQKSLIAEMQDCTLIAVYGHEGPLLEAARRGSYLARSSQSEPLQLSEAEQQAHARHLMKEALQKSQAVDRPRAVLTGGQPGSGKSYIVNSVGVEFEGMGGVIKIDPDEIRPTLPYMAERIAAGNLDIPNAANIDAGTIAYQMVQIAKEHRRNIVIDGTLQNTSRALDLAGEMRKAEYHVEFHGMATYPDLSHARTYSRREEQIAQSPTGFGRGVSDEFHDQAVKGFGLTVEMFQQKAAVDSMTLHFGNEGPPVSTRFINGSWAPAVDMKATLDHAHQQPSPEVLKQASDTWTTASKAMKARNADPEEIAKVDKLCNSAMDREESQVRSAKTTITQAAQLHAMRHGGQSM